MSEDVLKTVLQLFSVVAKVDEVTEKEHEQVKSFLEDHVSLPKVSYYLKQFEQLSTQSSPDCGANSNATAAPIAAPATNHTTLELS